MHPAPRLTDTALRLLFYITFMSPIVQLLRRTPRLLHLYIAVCALYLPSYLDGSERKGGHSRPWFKAFRLWGSMTRQYFNLKLVRSAPLDPNQHYIFALHPHAVAPYGTVLNLHTEANQFSKLYPGIRIRTLAASILFYVPLVRDLWLSLGFIDASRYSAMNVLRAYKPKAMLNNNNVLSSINSSFATPRNGSQRDRSGSSDFRLHPGMKDPNSGRALSGQHGRKATTHFDAKGMYVDPMTLPACTTFSATALQHSDLGVSINTLPSSNTANAVQSKPLHAHATADVAQVQHRPHSDSASSGNSPPRGTSPRSIPHSPSRSPTHSPVRLGNGLNARPLNGMTSINIGPSHGQHTASHTPTSQPPHLIQHATAVHHTSAPAASSNKELAHSLMTPPSPSIHESKSRPISAAANMQPSMHAHAAHSQPPFHNGFHPRERTNSTASTVTISPSLDSLRTYSLSSMGTNSSALSTGSPISSPRHLPSSSSQLHGVASSTSSQVGSSPSLARRTLPHSASSSLSQHSMSSLAPARNSVVTNTTPQETQRYAYTHLEASDYLSYHAAGPISIGVFVGGKKECLLTNPPRSKELSGAKPTVVYTLYLRRRKGFIRLALQSGAHLVPVFTFGDSLAHEQLMYADLSGSVRVKQPKQLTEKQRTNSANVHKPSFDADDLPSNSNSGGAAQNEANVRSRAPTLIINSLRVFNQWWYEIFGVPIPIVRNIIPHRCNITTVVGKPIAVKYIPAPTEQEINELHMLYINELTKLFYENREKYSVGSVLRII